MLRDDLGQPLTILREDYSATPYWIDTVDLTFDLDPAKTRVVNRMTPVSYTHLTLPTIYSV